MQHKSTRRTLNLPQSSEVGFSRPGGQKSNKSSASDVQGPDSTGSCCSGTALNALRVKVGLVWTAVKALGSEIDLRKGASRALLTRSFCGKEGGSWALVGFIGFCTLPAPRFGAGAAIISSRMNWVESEGMNSAFVESIS